MGCCASEDRTKKQRGGQPPTAPQDELDERLNDIFLKYNKDGSGSLTKDELHDLLNDALRQQSLSITPEQVQAFIKVCDANGNGRIEREQLKQLYKRLQHNHH